VLAERSLTRRQGNQDVGSKEHIEEAKNTLKKRRHLEMFSGLVLVLNESCQLAAANPLEYYQR
jgi:hypothetical protein